MHATLTTDHPRAHGKPVLVYRGHGSKMLRGAAYGEQDVLPVRNLAGVYPLGRDVALQLAVDGVVTVDEVRAYTPISRAESPIFAAVLESIEHAREMMAKHE